MSRLALITGASSGIGSVYARVLAAQGYNLIITARRADRLQQLAEELSTQVEVEIIAADLSTAEGIGVLEARIKKLDRLSMLINNAGFGVRADFVEADIARWQAMLDVHVTATMRLTHAALPGMIAAGEGTIINVASIAAFISSGGNTMYSGTKALLNYFSENLQGELKDTGIKIQSLCPGYTYSGFHGTADYEGFDRKQVPDALWMTAEEVVDISLAALNKKRVVIVPGLRYQLIAFLMRTGLSGMVSAIRNRLRAIRK